MSADGAAAQRTRRPSEAEVRDALAGVLCRCTGYRKIVEAVLAVAAGAGRRCAGRRQPGKRSAARVARLDAPAKVTRRRALRRRRAGPACAEPVLAMRVVRSPHAHAAFDRRRPRARCARAGPGLVDVVSAADVPYNAFAIFPDLRDQPVLADGVVRFRGEAVLALVGDAATVAAIADAEVPIRYEPLAAYERIAAALAAAAGGASLHARYPTTCCAAAASSAATSTRALAARRRSRRARVRDAPRRARLHRAGGGLRRDRRGRDAGGAPLRRVRIFACTQTPYMDRDEIASVLRVALEQVHIVPSAIGGGFGGKLDLSVQPLLAVAAWKLGRAGAPGLRAARVDAVEHQAPSGARCARRAACDDDGRLVAFDFAGDFNTGAYSSWGPTVANRVPIHASGPYRVAARARADARRAHAQQRRRRVPRLRRAAVDAARRAADRRARRAHGHRRARVPLPQRAASPATRRRPGRRSPPASACATASMRCGRRGATRWPRRGALNARAARRLAAAPRRRHRLHVVRHRQHGDRQSVDDARRAALECGARRAT